VVEWSSGRVVEWWGDGVVEWSSGGVVVDEKRRSAVVAVCEIDCRSQRHFSFFRLSGTRRKSLHSNAPRLQHSMGCH
jgi:hypothetical protein